MKKAYATTGSQAWICPECNEHVSPGTYHYCQKPIPVYNLGVAGISIVENENKKLQARIMLLEKAIRDWKEDNLDMEDSFELLDGCLCPKCVLARTVE